ncbi:CAI-1 autoinducer sensor kinase/phosphatase cqsS isoform, partial [Thalictrum thalictroides]
MTDSSDTSSDKSDDEWELAELVVCEAIMVYKNRFNKRPYRTDPLSGKQYVNNVFEGHEDRSLDVFRMRSNVLFDLCDALRERKLLHNTRYVSVEEQVSIFLYIVGKNDSNRTVADRFQHSGETISRHFRN